MVPIAWICSILGIGLTWLVLLANAMKTAPGKLTLSSAAGLSALPLLAILVVVAGVWKYQSAQQGSKGVLIYSVPFLISLFTLAMIVEAYNPLRHLRSGRPEVKTPVLYSFDGESAEPFYRFEIRRVLESAEPGSLEVKSMQNDENYFVGDEILLSTDDIASSYVGGPYTVSRYVIGVNFKEESHEKVRELSRADIGKQWAILLNGEVITAPAIAYPFSEKVIIEDQFTKEEAEDFARGIVGSTSPGH